MAKTKALFARRQRRTRYALRQAGGDRPRLSVFRSGKHIYAQLIDDAKGATLAQASTLEQEVKGTNGSTVEAAKKVGTLIAKRGQGGAYRFDIHLQGDDETVFFDV